MKLKPCASLEKRPPTDALILPFFEGQNPAFSGKVPPSLYRAALKLGDFSGKKGEVLLLYPEKGKDKRIVLVGLGKEKAVSSEEVRRSFGKALQEVKTSTINVCAVLPKNFPEAAIEGALLAAYVFDENKSKKDKTPKELHVVGANTSLLKQIQTVVESVNLARDLVISNADKVTPQFLGEVAEGIAKKYSSVKTTVFGKKQIEKEGLTLLSAVSRGASVDPALIVIEYTGNPKSKDWSALVGKGITFDTGGLNLKPTGGIEAMRDDMAGSAAVLGTMRSIASLRLPVNVVGVIVSCENAVGSRSFKPGDVYQSHAGITVEITNTDAEGRLVLADALSYVQKKFAPKEIIDLATLTGGIVIALGEEVTGLFSNNDRLANELIKAGEKTSERLWRLPLYEDYAGQFDSKVADTKNSTGRKATSIRAGIFLQKFVKKCAWAHLDIAGTAFHDPLYSYNPVQATGVGVRLLTEFFASK